ncbi:MAG: hypothetical protein JOZ69_10025 [Myxococcales bacterium]|nr:hypothetical protein [Myxococcales bacterium]
MFGAVMPKGVEHSWAMSWSCSSTPLVIGAVMPKGGEHLNKADRELSGVW